MCFTHGDPKCRRTRKRWGVKPRGMPNIPHEDPMKQPIACNHFREDGSWGKTTKKPGETEDGPAKVGVTTAVR